MARHKLLPVLAAAGLLAVGAAGAARAQEFQASLLGTDEIGELNAETGAIQTNGSGTLELYLDSSAKVANYLLSYANLSSPVIMAHIHFGKEGVPGGILVWLCQTHAKPSPVPRTPYCPPHGGIVSGTITAASIVSIPGEGVAAGDFGVLVSALATGTAYANVHTVNFPSGEIRGELGLVTQTAQ